MASVQPQEQAQERKFLGVTLGDVSKLLIGGVLFAIPVSFITNYLNTKAPHLTYSVVDTIIFPGEKNRFGIINATVANDGSKEAEDLDISFAAPDAPIHELKVTPENLMPVIELKESKVRITMKTLNPGETIQIALMVGNPDVLPKNVDFRIRGKGVNGDKQPLKKGFSDTFISILLTLNGFLIGVIYGMSCKLDTIVAREAAAVSTLAEVAAAFYDCYADVAVERLIPVYADKDGKTEMKDVKGLYIKKRLSLKSESMPGVLPTTVYDWRQGEAISPIRWDRKTVCKRAWYKDPDDGTIKVAWADSFAVTR